MCEFYIGSLGKMWSGTSLNSNWTLCSFVSCFLLFSTTPKIVTFQFTDVTIQLFSASVWYAWREPSRHHKLPFLLFFVVFAGFRSLCYQWTCSPVQRSKQVFSENCQSCVATLVTVSIIYLSIFEELWKRQRQNIQFKSCLTLLNTGLVEQITVHVGHHVEKPSSCEQQQVSVVHSNSVSAGRLITAGQTGQLQPENSWQRF